MSPGRRAFLAMLGALAAAGAGSARAQSSSDSESEAGDWPQFQYDAGNTGRTPAGGPGTDLGQRWIFPGDESFSGVALTDQRAVAGSHDGVLYAVDRATGAPAWTFETGDRIRATPTVAGDLVVVGSEDGSLYGVDAADGTETWAFDAGGPVTASATLADGTLYVGTGGGSFHAVDAATGRSRWEVGLTEVASAPAVDADTVYVGTVAGLYLLDRETGEPRGRVSGEKIFYRAPTVADGTLVAVSLDRETVNSALHVYDLEAGELGWEHQFDDRADEWSPAVDGDAVYATGAGDDIVSFSLEDGTEQWRVDLNSAGEKSTGSDGATTATAADDSDDEPGSVPFASPVVAGDVVYAGSGTGTVYALDRDTGAVRASHEASLSGSPAVTPEELVVPAGANVVSFGPDAGGAAQDSGPTARISVEAVDGDRVVLSGSDSTAGTELRGYEWDLDGDGDFEETGERVEAVVDGARRVRLRVTTASGATATVTRTVRTGDASPSLRPLLGSLALGSIAVGGAGVANRLGVGPSVDGGPERSRFRRATATGWLAASPLLGVLFVVSSTTPLLEGPVADAVVGFAAVVVAALGIASGLAFRFRDSLAEGGILGASGVAYATVFGALAVSRFAPTSLTSGLTAVVTHFLLAVVFAAAVSTRRSTSGSGSLERESAAASDADRTRSRGAAEGRSATSDESTREDADDGRDDEETDQASDRDAGDERDTDAATDEGPTDATADSEGSDADATAADGADDTGGRRVTTTEALPERHARHAEELIASVPEIRDVSVEGVEHGVLVCTGHLIEDPDRTVRVLTASDSSVERDAFEAAMRNWSTLGYSEHIVQVVDWGVDPVPWLATEPVTSDLDDRLASATLADRVGLAEAVVEAVQRAARYNARHHSLSPSRVVFGPDGTPKVDGWGAIAALGRDSVPSPYAAPEQVGCPDAGSTGRHTTVYRVGAVTFYLLSGRPPFEASGEALRDRICGGDVTPPSEHAPDCTSELDLAVRRAMARDPDRRYGSPHHFKLDLQTGY